MWGASRGGGGGRCDARSGRGERGAVRALAWKRIQGFKDSTTVYYWYSADDGVVLTAAAPLVVSAGRPLERGTRPALATVAVGLASGMESSEAPRSG